MSMEHGVPLSGDTSLLRRLNLRAVLRVLHAGGAHTISELAEQANLSRPTTTQALDALIAAGWVMGSSRGREAVMGRPAQLFEFRPDAGHVIGIDVGAYKALVLICDLNGTEIARARRELDPTAPPESRLRVLGAVIDDALGAMPTGAEPVMDAVLATPGTLDRDGVVVYNTVIPGWLGQNPGSWVADRYDLPVVGMSDMAMSALAEQWRGAAQNALDVVYLHAGRRPGAAALIGGKPHLGFHNASPEVGLWKATPWRTDYSDLLRVGTQQESGARELFAAAAAGDPDALNRVGTYADELVAGIIPMVISIDPELLVVGGGMSEAGEAIVGPIRERIQAETMFAPTVIASSLGDEAVALGAVRYALDRSEDRLFAELGTSASGASSRTTVAAG
jgi:predicted NBD/HSP70 family sugar kinase